MPINLFTEKSVMGPRINFRKQRMKKIVSPRDMPVAASRRSNRMKNRLGLEVHTMSSYLNTFQLHRNFIMIGIELFSVRQLGK